MNRANINVIKQDTSRVCTCLETMGLSRERVDALPRCNWRKGRMCGYEGDPGVSFSRSAIEWLNCPEQFHVQTSYRLLINPSHAPRGKG
jgi:hypothetical protein